MRSVLNPHRVKKVMSAKARNYKLKHTAVEPLVYSLITHWNIHGHLDWFKMSEQRARLLIDPAPTTIVFAVALDAIKKNIEYYLQPMTEEETRNELDLRTEDPDQQIPAEVLSATDLGRYRE